MGRDPGCTCGSGGHPRKCDVHPFEIHIHRAEINIWATFDDDELSTIEKDHQLRGLLKRLVENVRRTVRELDEKVPPGGSPRAPQVG